MRLTIMGAGVAAGAVLAVAGGFAVEGTIQSADAQSGFSVTPGQLQTNQKISQAAVRRSNRSLNYLAPIRTRASEAADDGRKGVTPLAAISGAGQGWGSGQIADGAITRAKIGDGAVDASKLGDGAATNVKLAHPTYSAVVAADGTLDRGDGATGSSRLATGTYEVLFGVDVRACTYVVSQGGVTNATEIGFASAARRNTSALGVFVATTDAVASPTDRPFHLIVHC